jgi:pimeloyl-ACP methyl ester carboxylesterase
MHVIRRGSGHAVLFIHGMPTNHHLWNEIIERLFEQFTCLAIDLPGLGKSPSVAYGPKHLESLAAEIDALRIEHGIEKWHVVGHDAGSAVAVNYAYYYQQHVDSLALLSPALFPELKPYFLLEPLRKPFVGECLAPLIKSLFWKVAMRRALEGERGNVEDVLENFYAPFAGRGGAWNFMRVLRWGKPSEVLAKVPDFLPQLRIPTLILHGERDPAIPASFARRASALIPNSSLLTVDSGHFIPLNQPEFVAANLLRLFGQGQRVGGVASA